jgi:LacI family transcriptional regulator
MSRRVTMADVAREAGVSMMTVSRVINNKEGISDSTRSRIQEVIDQLGYRPSNIARGLVTKQTGTLGLVVPDNANPFFSEVARGAEHVAYENGYNVFLCNTEEDKQRELTVLRSLEEKRVDGVMVCSSRLNDEELCSALTYYPAAVLVNRQPVIENNGVVMVDDEAGARMMTQHLLQSGHRAIGFLAGPSSSYSRQLRFRGYCEAMHAVGLDYHPEWIHPCSPIVEGGREAAFKLLTTHPELTALFCFNDLVAVGALQACSTLGRAVPDDIAIVGCDDIPLAALVNPALTTCHVPRYELGAQAMKLLLDHIQDCSEGCESVTFQPTLVVRASAP